MEISIIVPVYNAAPLIGRCLDSILAQKGGHSFEVILVDDGSKDNSIEVIESYNRSEFQIIRQENAGPAAARNKGISVAKGKYIAFIDADDYWEESFIDETATFLEANDSCVAVNVAQRHMTTSGEHVVPSECINGDTTPLIPEDFFAFWAEHLHVCTGSILMRRETVVAIGGQREDLRINEDNEFWFMLSTYGNIAFIPKVLFVSDGGDVVQKEGWLAKMQVRWKNASDIATWEQRLVKRLADDLPLGYLIARGRVSRTMTYCQLLSGRIGLARKEALKYGKYFTPDNMAKLMNLCKYSRLTWWIMCQILKWREYHRK